jgi:sec-independent protein translocase protein TatA
MNIGDLFDSPLKIAIIAVVVIVLFGSKKLPHAARSLGQSMRILKREVQGLHEDDEPTSDTSAQSPGSTAAAIPAPAELTATAPTDQQAQIDALQQQIRDLQRATAMDAPAPTVQAGVSAESPHTQQPS